ncbi:hypothetical protein M527_06510 [Sphingobium indicum IP26]|uniref:Uncharacterized protein n=1 Tax=Sphingobium indicum F2 TaxID=1450518 RepID=A0A8E0WU90_9SPHN|nr:hypothetical protein [Sphingobium indicum]EPR09775.1 hypothetical protein M527_06510 [Sphingobium indicum IP26]KER37275.1 hypothetical protein AL00_06275 [Sphingobium indicum F2]
MDADDKPPMWAIERALTLFGQWGNLGVDTHPATYAFARYIAQHEQPPVDPDVIAVRDIAACFQASWEMKQSYMRGDYDGDYSFSAALALYRKHKEAGK